MKKRTTLPCITDTPKAAFLNGWYSGLAVGFITAVALAVIVFKVAR